MGSIAAKFGRRLSVTCIGVPNEDEDFSTLNSMVDEATSYSAVASFGKTSLDVDSLSNIITGLASSLTLSKSEGTSMETRKPRNIRMDIIRERKNTPDDENVTSDWNCYDSKSTTYVNRIWTWSNHFDDFAQVVDSRCTNCWKNTDGNDVRLCTIHAGMLGLMYHKSWHTGHLVLGWFTDRLCRPFTQERS